MQDQINIRQLKAKVDQLKANNLVVSTSGVAGQGFSINATAAFLALNCLANALLNTQISDTDTDGPSNTQPGVGYVDVEQSIDEDMRPTFEGSKIVMGENWFKKYDLEIPTESATFSVLMCPPQRPEYFVTSAAKLTDKYCHAFQFVLGCMPPDSEFIGDFLYTNFPLLFHEDPEISNIIMKNICDNLLPIVRHGVGQAILHVILSLSIAFRCGGVCKVIMDSTSLLGTVIAVRDKDQVLSLQGITYRPLSGPSLTSCLDSWMTSSSARDTIAAALSNMIVLSGSKKVIITRDDIKEFSDLCSEIRKRARISSFSEDLLMAIGRARYDHTFLSGSEEHITLCLTQIASKVIPSTSYVTKTLFQQDDTVLAANLSLFGPSSISFLNPGGKSINLYLNADDDPLHKKKKEITVQRPILGKKGKRKYEEVKSEVFAWDRLTVSRVSIENAVKDMITIQSIHKIHQVQAYDNQILGNVDVHDIREGRSDMLDALRRFGATKDVLTIRDTRVESSGNKKARVETPDAEDGGVDVNLF